MKTSPTGFPSLVLVGAGDAGDGDRDVGGRARERAFRHRDSDLRADRAARAQVLGGHAERRGLVRLGVGDEAAVQRLASKSHVDGGMVRPT